VEQIIVETTGWIRTGEDAETVEVHLSYHPADPCAVTVAVTGDGHDHTWVLGRDLLADGLRSSVPVGEGVVHVHATSVLTELAFTGARREPLVLRLPWWNTREFVRMTHAVVPTGTEEYDVDAWLAALMGTREP
jgi:hypothetical protein